jgi:hypothetical protein
VDGFAEPWYPSAARFKLALNYLDDALRLECIARAKELALFTSVSFEAGVAVVSVAGEFSAKCSLLFSGQSQHRLQLLSFTLSTTFSQSLYNLHSADSGVSEDAVPITLLPVQLSSTVQLVNQQIDTSTEPLRIIHNVLHALCLRLQLRKLVQQLQQAAATSSLGDSTVNFDARTGRIDVSFWRSSRRLSIVEPPSGSPGGLMVLSSPPLCAEALGRLRELVSLCKEDAQPRPISAGAWFAAGLKFHADQFLSDLQRACSEASQNRLHSVHSSDANDANANDSAVVGPQFVFSLAGILFNPLTDSFRGDERTVPRSLVAHLDGRAVLRLWLDVRIGDVVTETQVEEGRNVDAAEEKAQGGRQESAASESMGAHVASVCSWHTEIFGVEHVMKLLETEEIAETARQLRLRAAHLGLEEAPVYVRASPPLRFVFALGHLPNVFLACGSHLSRTLPSIHRGAEAPGVFGLLVFATEGLAKIAAAHRAAINEKTTDSEILYPREQSAASQATARISESIVATANTPSPLTEPQRFSSIHSPLLALQTGRLPITAKFPERIEISIQASSLAEAVEVACDKAAFTIAKELLLPCGFVLGPAVDGAAQFSTLGTATWPILGFPEASLRSLRFVHGAIAGGVVHLSRIGRALRWCLVIWVVPLWKYAGLVGNHAPLEASPSPWPWLSVGAHAHDVPAGLHVPDSLHLVNGTAAVDGLVPLRVDLGTFAYETPGNREAEPEAPSFLERLSAAWALWTGMTWLVSSYAEEFAERRGCLAGGYRFTWKSADYLGLFGLVGAAENEDGMEMWPLRIGAHELLGALAVHTKDVSLSSVLTLLVNQSLRLHALCYIAHRFARFSAELGRRIKSTPMRLLAQSANNWQIAVSKVMLRIRVMPAGVYLLHSGRHPRDVLIFGRAETVVERIAHFVAEQPLTTLVELIKEACRTEQVRQNLSQNADGSFRLQIESTESMVTLRIDRRTLAISFMDFHFRGRIDAPLVVNWMSSLWDPRRGARVLQASSTRAMWTGFLRLLQLPTPVVRALASALVSEQQTVPQFVADLLLVVPSHGVMPPTAFSAGEAAVALSSSREIDLMVRVLCCYLCFCLSHSLSLSPFSRSLLLSVSASFDLCFCRSLLLSVSVSFDLSPLTHWLRCRSVFSVREMARS